MSGFETTSIEKELLLHQQLEKNIARLDQLSSLPFGNRINGLNDVFSHHPEDNSSAVTKALSEADFMFCYPWPKEIKRRFKLFRSCAKKGAKLIIYQSGIDQLYLTSEDIQKTGLRVVNIANFYQNPEENYRNQFTPTPLFGSYYFMFEKIN